MSAETTRRVFRFGAFEVDEAASELRRQGLRVKLHSQPFQILMMLLERPSELVHREEIRRRLWDEGTFVDFDHGLNTSINKVRHALRDSASDPRYIETIPGKGYRFIAPIMVATARPAPATPVLPAEKDTVKTNSVLATRGELPAAPRMLVLSLLLLVQAMYLAFYVGALANLQEIRDILEEARPVFPPLLFTVLVATAAALIPVRLFICAAVAFDLQELPTKFRKLFPVLLFLDLAWALSPFLLVHHISVGIALGMSAALLYTPFAQRSLMLMYSRPDRPHDSM